jgi:type IV fimbrial biogenesis protein FimT
MTTNQRGFTLLELMLAVALLAIVLGFGLPNFRDFIRNSRMAAAANDVIADVNLARSESIKRRVPVTLCKSADLVNCDDVAGTQFRGWIVFVDDADAAVEDATNDGNGAIDDDEVILRTTRISPEIDSAEADGVIATFIPSGFVRPGGNNVQRILFCDARGNTVTVGGDSAARAVSIAGTGRAVVTRDPAVITDQFGDCP